MQERDLSFSILQWRRQEGVLRAVVHISRASNTLFLSRLNTQIVLFGSLPWPVSKDQGHISVYLFLVLRGEEYDLKIQSSFSLETKS